MNRNYSSYSPDFFLPFPSPEDLEITNKLKEAGNLIDIKVLDHVIIGSSGWWSEVERG